MDNIYGPITEHEEYDVTDSRRFTVTILPHTFEIIPNSRLPFACWKCGERENHFIHQNRNGENNG